MKTRILLLFTTIFLIISNLGLAQSPYKLPFPAGQVVYVTQGNNGSTSHNQNNNRYAWDFVPFQRNTSLDYEVCASRNGTVVEYVEDFADGTSGINEANYIKIKHTNLDGSFEYSMYWHLKHNGVLVELNQEVSQGQVIGYIGDTGLGGYHLHFMVNNGIGYSSSTCLSKTFSDVLTDNGIPVYGSKYTSGTVGDIINSKIDIYAGTILNPIAVKIWFTKTGITDGTDINNLKIDGKAIPWTSLDNITYNSISGKGSFTINLTTSLLSTLGITANGEYDISFDVDGANHHFFGADQLYFLDPTSLTDIQVNDWCKEYIYDGVELGLFKGNNNLFGKGDYLTRSQAAKVIVMAGIKLGILDLDLSTTGGTFTDVPISNWAFPFVQTLRNKGYITASTTFLPNDKITAGAFAKLLCNTLLITDADINSNQLNNNTGYLGSKISIQSTYFQEYLDRLAKIVVIKDDVSGVGYVKSLASGLREVTNSEITTSQVVFNGDNYITKAIMAKVLLNAYEYRLQNPAFSKSGANVTNFVVVGDEFELTANTSGSVSSTVNLSYTMESGQTKDIGFDSEYSNGIPLVFYWVANGGQLTDLFPISHKKVRFTAPTVSTPTNFTLYMFVGTGTGKVYHANITITVNPAGTSITEPTVQASNISFTNTTYNSVTVNWNRGNGQNCLVAITENSLVSDLPVPNTIYSGNSNFSISPVILTGSDTKVIYTGSGNSVTISGLTSNTTYKFQIYEYNGNTTQNVKYLLSNPAFNTVLIPNPPAVTVDFGWNVNKIIAGQSVTFISQGTNYDTHSWTFSGASPSTSTASSQSVIFSSSGNFNVTLNVSNSTTGQTKSITKNLTVYNASAVLPDLIVNNATTDLQSALPGYSLATNCSVLNQGIEFSNGCYVSYYLSNDNSWSADDICLSTCIQDYISSLNPTQSVNVIGHAQIPAGTVAGSYYLLFKIDVNNSIIEINESNNVYSLPITVITALPDFTFQSLTVNSPINSGGQTASSFTIKNNGNVSSQTSITFYLSIDGGTNYNFYLGRYDYATINAGSSANFNINLKIPYTVPNGICYVKGFIDNDLLIPELNEGDNVSLPISITISNPNQPTNQASNYTLTNITDNSVRLTWQNGNGVGRVVICKKNGFCEIPIDGTTYTANSYFPSGQIVLATSGNDFGSKIVYNGTGNFVDITGLTAGETYGFSVFEYNGSGTSIDYLQIPGYYGSGYEHSGTFITTKVSSVSNSNDWFQICGINANSSKEEKQLFFIDENNGWLLQSNFISKTNDGGKTWFSKTIVNSDWSSLSFNSLFFVDNNVGWIVGSNGKILKTIDGGNSWAIQTSNSQLNINSIFFLNSNLGFAVSGGWWDSKGGEILKTSNGGTTWTKVYTGQNIFSVYFVNSNIGFVGGKNGLILKTIDGGNTWIQQNSGLNQSAASMKKIEFYNENIGWAVTYDWNKLIKTTDGGQTWTIIDFPNTIYSMDFVDDKLGLIVGPGYIGKTVDGGNNWTITNYSSKFFYQAHCVDASVFYLAGSSGTGIYKSTTSSQSQFINAPTLSNTSLCIPATFTLNYTISGTFNSGNIFTAQLSDINGSFDNPVSIGTVTATANGTISCLVPSGFTSGSNYKIRIIASNPVTTGASTTVTINSTPVVNITEPSQSSYLITSSAITMVGSPAGGTFKINNVSATQFNPSTLGAGTHTVEYTYTLNGCSASITKNVTVSVPQSISVSNLSPTTFCAGSNATVNYTIAGTFASDNVFRVELSNSTGDFTNPVSINSVTSNTAGSITCQIPVISAQGSGYKIRVVSSNPQVTSNVSNAFTINAALTPSISIISNKTEVCAGGSVLFTGSQQNGGASPQYQWKINGVNAGTNSLGFSTTSLSNNDIVTLQMTSNANCAYPQFVISNEIPITVNPVVTPIVEIFATATTINLGENVDFMAITDNSGSSPTYQWFVNNIDQNINSPFFSSSILQNNDIVKTTIVSNATCLASNNISSQLTMTIPQYLVSVSSNNTTGGNVSGNANYYSGQNASVTATANTGYHFVNWTENGTQVSTSATYNFTVTGNRILVANFAINVYTLTYIAGTNGTISGTATQTVNYNSNGTAVTAVPNTGYHFVNWSDGSTQNPRTDLNVTTNVSVTANFAINTYTLTYIAGTNGTISGTATQTVNYNSNGTAVTAVPNTGYHFVNWSDGSTQNPRTDLNVTANLSVTANFEINTGILELFDSNTMIVYPNPNNGSFVISFDNNYIGELQIKIYSVNGSIIKELEINKSTNEFSYSIDLGNVAVGTYYIDLITTKEKVTKSIIIN